MNTALRFHVYSLKLSLDRLDQAKLANQKKGDCIWVLPVLEFLV